MTRGRLRGLLPLAALGMSVLTSCMSLDPPLESRSVGCGSDAECGAGQVCFADGCGDPGDSLVIEVIPGGSKGLHAQDFPVTKVDGTLNLELFGPSLFQGELLERSVDGGTQTAYGGAVAFRVTGESALIPGQVRRFEGTLVPENGVYALPVGAGIYTVVATPATSLRPPLVLTQQRIAPGEERMLDLAFPAEALLLRVKGRLVVKHDPETKSKAVLLPADVITDVQAFHPLTGHPLSQRTPVAVDDGSFELWVAPEAQFLDHFEIRAAPREAGTLVPEKTFGVSADALPEVYELGSFGAPVTVQGRVIDVAGQPVSTARVYLEGRVEGGGHYRSALTSTDASGAFSVPMLPTATDATTAVFAAPPPESRAGLLETRLRVEAAAPAHVVGSLVAPDKVPVAGALVDPAGGPAAGVRVLAVPLEPASNTRPLPVGAETLTHPDGSFSLLLDPARYRLDFIPGGALPRMSRFLDVELGPEVAGFGAAPVMLPPYALSHGRTLRGTVNAIQDRFGAALASAPYAAVRFFRVVAVQGRRSSILLAEGVADGSGQYEVIIPTR